jgi:transcriptional regulator with XRE-family HTH domain
MTMKKVRQLRTEKGVSLARLSRLSGVHPTTLRDVEAGRLVPYAGQLAKIAAALEVPVDTLLESRARIVYDAEPRGAA